MFALNEDQDAFLGERMRKVVSVITITGILQLTFLHQMLSHVTHHSYNINDTTTMRPRMT